MNKRGSIFIEVLIAIGIISVIAVSVFSSLFTQLRVYRAIEERMSTFHTISLVEDMMQRDLRNARFFTGHYCVGTASSFVVPSIVTRYDKKGNPIKEMVMLTLTWADRKLSRELTSILRGKKIDSAVVAKDVLKEVVFSYAIVNEENVIQWIDAWDGKDFLSLPHAIRIRYEFVDKVKERHFSERIVVLPHTGWVKGAV